MVVINVYVGSLTYTNAISTARVYSVMQNFYIVS